MGVVLMVDINCIIGSGGILKTDGVADEGDDFVIFKNFVRA